jgi:hypothetical protein
MHHRASIVLDIVVHDTATVAEVDGRNQRLEPLLSSWFWYLHRNQLWEVRPVHEVSSRSE